MKEELESKLKKAGFSLFSEMSYEEYAPYEKRIECSDLTYVIMYCYDTYPYYVKKVNDCLVIAAYLDEEAERAVTAWNSRMDWIYTVIIPLEDRKLVPAFEEVAALYKKWNIPMKLGTISGRYKTLLEQSALLKDSFSYHEERSDYVYDIAQYMDIEGGKNSRKRRDLNKIAREYPTVRVEKITDWETVKPLVMDIMDKWCDGYDCEKCAFGCERKVLEYLLDSHLTDKLCGAIMYLDDKPEMFAIAQVIEDMCYLFFKKSVNRIHGAFYYFEYEFLKMLKDVTYVNFQEDLGLPGLREYKRRRHPIRMIDKYETKVLYWENGHTANAEGMDYAGVKDWDELCQLWKAGFGDDKEYVTQFLSRFYTGKNVYVWRENGELATVVYDLPAQIVIPAEKGETSSVDAHYLYAITTKPCFRGRRLLEKLLVEIRKELGEDAVLFLVPDKEVIPYYLSLGMKLQTAVAGWEYTAETQQTGERDKTRIELCALWDAAYYRELRQQALLKQLEEKQQAFVSWNEKHIAWAMENIRMVNGQVYAIIYNGKKYLLAGKVQQENDGSNTFHVMETTIPQESLEEIGEELLQIINCSRLRQEPLQLMVQKELYENIYLAFPLG